MYDCKDRDWRDDDRDFVDRQDDHWSNDDDFADLYDGDDDEDDQVLT